MGWLGEAGDGVEVARKAAFGQNGGLDGGVGLVGIDGAKGGADGEILG